MQNGVLENNLVEKAGCRRHRRWRHLGWREAGRRQTSSQRLGLAVRKGWWRLRIGIGIGSESGGEEISHFVRLMALI